MAWHYTNPVALLARLSTNQARTSMTEVCQVESILMLAGTETILTFLLPLSAVAILPGHGTQHTFDVLSLSAMRGMCPQLGKPAGQKHGPLCMQTICLFKGLHVSHLHHHAFFLLF